ncbi:MAG: type II toxin-antitoxin system HicA family toxin [Chloroflexota bacterium]
MCLFHLSKPGMVVVPIHKGRTLKLGTLLEVLKERGETIPEEKEPTQAVVITVAV